MGPTSRRPAPARSGPGASGIDAVQEHAGDRAQACRLQRALLEFVTGGEVVVGEIFVDPHTNEDAISNQRRQSMRRFGCTI